MSLGFQKEEQEFAANCSSFLWLRGGCFFLFFLSICRTHTSLIIEFRNCFSPTETLGLL